MAYSTKFDVQCVHFLVKGVNVESAHRTPLCVCIHIFGLDLRDSLDTGWSFCGQKHVQRKKL